jgi:hypothetical protein
MINSAVRLRSLSFAIFLAFCFALVISPIASAQQTGGVSGTVTDVTGGAITDSTVTLVADGTQLTRVQKTNSVGSYDFVNLAIGTSR